jgi:type IV secretory pathway protease TraF
MIFMIEYDRPTRRTLLFKTFDDSDLPKARQGRLQIELDLNRRGLLMQHEILLLHARDEQSLRRTHSRYFENLPDEVRSPLVAAD